MVSKPTWFSTSWVFCHVGFFCFRVTWDGRSNRETKGNQR